MRKICYIIITIVVLLSFAQNYNQVYAADEEYEFWVEETNPVDGNFSNCIKAGNGSSIKICGGTAEYYLQIYKVNDNG